MDYENDEIEYLASGLEQASLDERALQNHADKVATAYEDGYEDAAVIMLNIFFETLVTEDLAAEEEREDERELRYETSYDEKLDREAERMDELVPHLRTLNRARSSYLKKLDTDGGATVDTERCIELYRRTIEQSSYDIDFDPDDPDTQDLDRIDGDHVKELNDNGLSLVADLYIHSVAERRFDQPASETSSTPETLFEPDPYQLTDYTGGNAPVRVADSAVEDRLSDRIEDAYLNGVEPGAERLHNALSSRNDRLPSFEDLVEQTGSREAAVRQLDMDHSPGAQQPFNSDDVDRRLYSNAWNQMAVERNDMVHRMTSFSPDRYPSRREVEERIDALFGMEDDEWANNRYLEEQD